MAKKTYEQLESELTESMAALAEAKNIAAEAELKTNECLLARKQEQQELQIAANTIASKDSEIATLSKVNDELSITIENLTKQLDAKKTIQDTAKEIADKKTPPIPKSPFTVAGKSYKFISPVAMYKKQRIVAAEAINNQALLDELVGAKVGFIVEA